jgi:hypothetical protein
MERTAAETITSERVPAGQLLRVGAVAAALSAGASVAGAVGAAIIFAIISWFTRRPIRVFLGVAAVGLLLSFLPIALAGATGSSAATNVGPLTTLD